MGNILLKQTATDVAWSGAVGYVGHSSNADIHFPSSNLISWLDNVYEPIGASGTAWSGATGYVGHSSNADIHFPSSNLISWLDGVYEPIGASGTAWSGAAEYIGMSGSYSTHRQDTTIHFTKSSIDDNYMGSSQAIARFVGSSQYSTDKVNYQSAYDWTSTSGTRYEEILASGVQYTSAYVSASTGVFALQTIDLTAGAGLTGGGTIAATRDFAVGAGMGITVNANDIEVTDYIASSTAISRFADSSNINARFVASSTALAKFQASGVVPAHLSVTSISTQSISGVTEYDVYMDCIPGSTYCTLQSWTDNYDSSVILSGANITIGGPTGSISISESFVAVREGTNAHDLLWRADIAATTDMTLGAGAHYIYVDYNGGTPKYDHRTAGNFNGTTQITVARVYNDWETGYIPEVSIVEGGYRLNDFPAKTLKRFSSYGTERQTGVVTASSQTSGHPSSLSVTAGVMWRALNKFTTTAFNCGHYHDITALDKDENWFSVTGSNDTVYRGNHIKVEESTGNDGIYIVSSLTHPSGTDSGYRRIYIWSGQGQGISDTTVDGHVHDEVFTYWRRDGSGGWLNASGQIGLDINHYDNNDPTIGNIGNTKYGLHWVYVDITGDVNILYGQDSYSLADAEDASSPATIPTQLDVTSILACRILVQEDSTTLTDAEFATPWTTTFTAGSVDQHNDLGGLNVGDYVHLTAANHTDLTDGGETTLHIHDSRYYTEAESIANFPASSTAIERFADSSQYSTDKITYALIADTVASSTAIERFADSSQYSTDKATYALIADTIASSVAIGKFLPSSDMSDKSDNDVLTWDATNNFWSSQATAAGGIDGWYDLDTGIGITAFGGAVAISGTQAETLSVADYIASTNAVERFADSSQYATDKITYALIADTVASSTAQTKFLHSGVTLNAVSSQNISGGAITTDDFTLNANTISGLIDPTYPSAAANKHFVNYPDWVSSQAGISGSWVAPIYRGAGKPTASNALEGQIFRTSGGTGEKTYLWCCVKNDADGYEHIQLGVST